MYRFHVKEGADGVPMYQPISYVMEGFAAPQGRGRHPFVLQRLPVAECLSFSTILYYLKKVLNNE